MDAATASLIGTGIQGGIGAGTGILGSILGYVNNQNNIRNVQQINAQNLAQAKELQEKAWERDDNAYQRAVEDAEKAGLSPLAVLQAGTAGNTVTPLNQAIPTNSDLTTMITSLLSASGAIDKARESYINETKNKNDYDIAKKTLKFQEKQLEQTFTLKSKELDQQNNELIADINKFNKSQALLTAQLNETINSSNYERLQKASDQSIQEFTDFCNTWGIVPRTVEYTNFNEFLKANEVYNSELLKIYKQLPKELKDIYESQSSGKNRGIGLGIGGQQGGINLNLSSGDSQSTTQDAQTKAVIAEAFKYLKKPIFRATKQNENKYNYENIEYEK